MFFQDPADEKKQVNKEVKLAELGRQRMCTKLTVRVAVYVMLGMESRTWLLFTQQLPEKVMG